MSLNYGLTWQLLKDLRDKTAWPRFQMHLRPAFRQYADEFLSYPRCRRRLTCGEFRSLGLYSMCGRFVEFESRPCSKFLRLGRRLRKLFKEFGIPP